MLTTVAYFTTTTVCIEKKIADNALFRLNAGFFILVRLPHKTIHSRPFAFHYFTLLFLCQSCHQGGGTNVMVRVIASSGDDKVKVGDPKPL
jgi:hypothetical protein